MQLKTFDSEMGISVKPPATPAPQVGGRSAVETELRDCRPQV